MSSSDVLDVTVFNLGNLARQTIQHQAELRMLRLIMNQTSHIMMLVEGTSLTVNQWDKKLQAANWTLCSSDDGRHWDGVHKAETDTTIRKLAHNSGSEHQKIWHTIFEVSFGLTSTGCAVWKGGQFIAPRSSTSTMPFHEQHVDHAGSTLETCCFSVHISK